MLNKKSVLSLLLALVATVLVSCGGGKDQASPPTYNTQQLEQIERSATPVREARARITDMESYVKQERWSDAFSLIHGPLGGLRREMSYVTRNLLPEDQKKAREYSKKLFQDLERVDAAIEQEAASRALENYDRALNDFDNYLGLLPDTNEKEST